MIIPPFAVGVGPLFGVSKNSVDNKWRHYKKRGINVKQKKIEDPLFLPKIKADSGYGFSTT